MLILAISQIADCLIISLEQSIAQVSVTPSKSHLFPVKKAAYMAAFFMSTNTSFLCGEVNVGVHYEDFFPILLVIL